MRARFAGSLDALFTPLVQIGTEADKVDRHLVILTLPEMRDGVSLPVDFDRCGDDQATVTKLLEELEEPPLASEGGAEIGGRQRSLCLSKSQPKRYQAGPGTADGFVELLPGPEVIVLGLEPGQVCALHQAAEQIGRKKCAFSA